MPFVLGTERLEVERGMQRTEAEMIMRQHQLGHAKLMGRYAREKK